MITANLILMLTIQILCSFIALIGVFMLCYGVKNKRKTFAIIGLLVATLHIFYTYALYKKSWEYYEKNKHLLITQQETI